MTNYQSDDLEIFQRKQSELEVSRKLLQLQIHAKNWPVVLHLLTVIAKTIPTTLESNLRKGLLFETHIATAYINSMVMAVQRHLKELGLSDEEMGSAIQNAVKIIYPSKENE